MKLKKLLFASAMSLAACGILQAQNTQVIAHRGFWKTDGSAQNSIAALVKADSSIATAPSSMSGSLPTINLS